MEKGNYGVCETYGRKNLLYKLFTYLIRRSGWKVYSTLIAPCNWEESKGY